MEKVAFGFGLGFLSASFIAHTLIKNFTENVDTVSVNYQALVSDMIPYLTEEEFKRVADRADYRSLMTSNGFKVKDSSL